MSEISSTTLTSESKQHDTPPLHVISHPKANNCDVVGLNQLDITDNPSELSPAEYRELLEQIRTDYTIEECQIELLCASRYNDIDIVRGILAVHANKVLYYQDEQTGHSALHMAAANGHTDVVNLLLTVEKQIVSHTMHPSKTDATTQQQQHLVALTNQAGNTALHWAAANGQEGTVALLLQQPNMDVLVKNSAGRSALTEGFTSENEAVVQLLLEHDSASEEKLMQTGSATTEHNNTSTRLDNKDASSVTHQLCLGSTIQIKVRELAMGPEGRILGQVNPEDDTTGYGIWAASLVSAQWISDLLSKEMLACSNSSPSSSSTMAVNDDVSFASCDTVLELGAGCGVPGLVVAAARCSKRIYLTDFNETTVSNLDYNITINNLSDICQSCFMNWNDTTTWPVEDTIDLIIGSDLIYQTDMVPLLLHTIERLQPRRFLYTAPIDGRQGHTELLQGLMDISWLHLVSETVAPTLYRGNPLKSQDDEESFVHFHELGDLTIQFMLYDFQRKGQTLVNANQG